MDTSQSISACIARWGNSASIALMDPACQIFSTPVAPGIIGYRLEGKHVIVFGDPLCDQEHVPLLTTAFHQHFEGTAKNIIYVAATEQFTQGSLGSGCGAAIGIGREIILDPTKDPRQETGYRASLLRRNCKQAIKRGTTIHEYTDADSQLEKTMIALGESWSKRRKGPQVYLQNVDIFAHREHKRFFYAERKGKIVGILILNRLDAYAGWVISFSMLGRNAPHGTSELLIVSALEILGKEQCRFFAIGTVPIPRIEDIHGLNFLARFCVRGVYTLALKIFRLGDRERYWKKFAPTSQSTYLLLNKPTLNLRGIMGIMSALHASK